MERYHGTPTEMTCIEALVKNEKMAAKTANKKNKTVMLDLSQHVNYKCTCCLSMYIDVFYHSVNTSGCTTIELSTQS